MNWFEQEKEIDNAVALFPPAFGLRAYKDRLFRIERAACFYSTGQIVLYTSIYYAAQDRWLDFCKGTISDLKREIVCVKCRRPAGTRLNPTSNELDGPALNHTGMCFECHEED
jgi:hypothetical protein